MKKFVISTQGRLLLFFVPPDSPEVHPDEQVWNAEKHQRAGRAAPRSETELKCLPVSARFALQRLRRQVRGLFEHSDTLYAAGEVEQHILSGTLVTPSRVIGACRTRATGDCGNQEPADLPGGRRHCPFLGEWAELGGFMDQKPSRYTSLVLW